MHPDTFARTKNSLLALGGQRVWSLMVTLFGDLAQAEGSGINGPVLSAVMAEMNVRPEAVRVALHRLRNDGWIASEKHGRTGHHTLTPTSRNESVQASARIYASPLLQDANWQIAITEDANPETDMAKLGFAPLLPRVYLGGAQAIAPRNTVVLVGTTPPDWLRTQIKPLMLETEYAALLPVLKEVDATMLNETPSPLQTAVLRCLLVHNWRRVVLRHPALPRALLPAQWSGHDCHLLVDTLLTRFPRPEISMVLTD